MARIYDRHAAVVLALCRSAGLRDPEDAVQETFVRALPKLGDLADEPRLRSCLYGIARRVCSERRRATGRRRRRKAVAAAAQLAGSSGRTSGPDRGAATLHESGGRLAALTPPPSRGSGPTS